MIGYCLTYGTSENYNMIGSILSLLSVFERAASVVDLFENTRVLYRRFEPWEKYRPISQASPVNHPFSPLGSPQGEQTGGFQEMEPKGASDRIGGAKRPQTAPRRLNSLPPITPDP